MLTTQRVINFNLCLISIEKSSKFGAESGDHRPFMVHTVRQCCDDPCNSADVGIRCYCLGTSYKSSTHRLGEPKALFGEWIYTVPLCSLDVSLP